MLRSRSDVLDFVHEVTARYGSLDAFFAHLHAGPDDEPTVELPIITDDMLDRVAWSAADPASTEGRHRRAATTRWARLIGRT